MNLNMLQALRLNIWHVEAYSQHQRLSVMFIWQVKPYNDRLENTCLIHTTILHEKTFTAAPIFIAHPADGM